MKQRQLGPYTVSAIGLGCMGMSIIYGQPDDAASLSTLHRALDQNGDVTSCTTQPQLFDSLCHVEAPGVCCNAAQMACGVMGK